MATEKPTVYSKSVRLLLEDGIKNHSNMICLCGYDLKDIPLSLFEDPFDDCLQYLDLSNNGLAVLCNQISVLKNLTYLKLSGNKLRKIPSEIGSLRKLNTLDLSRNCLKTLPKELNNLKELETVNLSGNELSIVPDYLLRLPKLQEVYCIRNENLENVPRDVAAKGLKAMRNYLKIKVEQYEIVPQATFKDPHQRNQFGGMMNEVKKDWVIQREQFVRKTKNAGTQLDDKEYDEQIKDRSLQSLSPFERSASTQTEPDVDCSLFRDTSEEKQFTTSSSSELPNGEDFLVDLRESRKCDNTDEAIERLVELFCQQMHLVFECKRNFPSAALQNSVSEEKCLAVCKSDTPIKTIKPKAMCECCGFRKRPISTSEYGSMSAYSQQFEEDDRSCEGTDGSQHSEDFNDMDDDLSFQDEPSDWASELDFWSSSLSTYIGACNEIVMRQYGITIKIPNTNLSGHKKDDFSFQVISGQDFAPKLMDNCQLATPIVLVEPHGAKFYSSSPATVELPLNVIMENGSVLKCFVSDTNTDECPKWEEVSCDNFDLQSNIVRIKTTHFSMFCATLSKNFSCAKQSVSSSSGGVLTIEEVSGLKVQFSENSLSSDIEASMTILFDDAEYRPQNTNKPLASPIVFLGPNGTHFEDDVEVTLPLPGADEVFRELENPDLIILETNTDLSEKPCWTVLDTSYQISRNDGEYTVAFRVKHFTGFTTWWDTCKSSLRHVASRIIPRFSYMVYFQALMSDCHHNNQFGLCVFCHSAGNPPLTDCYQFPLEVGISKPRELKKGDIMIQLKSSLFKADEGAGESEDGLIKVERFNGYDFDKQFALRFFEFFKEGIFGKVHIKTKSTNDEWKEVGEMLLQKTFQKKRRLVEKLPTELETTAVQEIAGLLSIEDRWKELALTLCYTRREITEKFDVDEPIKEILSDFMGRGGDAGKFIKAMYEVARRLKLIPYEEMMENRENKRMEIRSEDSTNKRYCRCSPTPEETPIRNAKRKLNVSSCDESSLTDAKLDQIAGHIAKIWKRVGRHLKLDEKNLQNIDQTNQNESEREKAYQMLMAWKEMFPDDFDAETLGHALVSCDQKYTARQFLSY